MLSSTCGEQFPFFDPIAATAAVPHQRCFNYVNRISPMQLVDICFPFWHNVYREKERNPASGVCKVMGKNDKKEVTKKN